MKNHSFISGSGAKDEPEEKERVEEKHIKSNLNTKNQIH